MRMSAISTPQETKSNHLHCDNLCGFLVSHTLNTFVMQKKYIVYYFPAVLLLIPNISSSVNWGVPHGLHKIAPVSLSLTASIYRAHKLAYVLSLYFYTPWVNLVIQFF
jgi:hypothetical protein